MATSGCDYTHPPQSPPRTHITCTPLTLTTLQHATTPHTQRVSEFTKYILEEFIWGRLVVITHQPTTATIYTHHIHPLIHPTITHPHPTITPIHTHSVYPTTPLRSLYGDVTTTTYTPHTRTHATCHTHPSIHAARTRVHQVHP